MKYIKKIILPSLLLFPLGVFAADDLKELVNEIIEVINMVIPLLFAFALLAFMWAVVRYIASANVEKIKEARKYIIFSIVALAVMLSIWSLALFLKNSIFPGGPMPYDPETGLVDGGVSCDPNNCSSN
jgi:hypothetical protein